MAVVIEVGKVGRQVDSRGIAKAFTSDFFKEVAESYNPSNFKAPAIISHDTKGISDKDLHDNKELSYGVAQTLETTGDRLKVVFNKLSPKIKQHFDNGELLSVSPSFYPPNHSANPTPGKWSLRHVAFLGATPPAIKGLASPEFAEIGFDPVKNSLDFSFPVKLQETDDTLEFSIFSHQSRTLLSNLRDWLIEKHGKDEAEKILPSEAIANMEIDDRYLQDKLSDLQKEVMKLKYPPKPEEAMSAIANHYEEHNFKEMKHTKKNMKDVKAIKDMEDLEDMEEDQEDEYEDEEIKEKPKSKKKQKVMDLNEEPTIDYAEELAEERRQRRLLEAQFQNEQRKSEEERLLRKHEGITNFCEGLVREGYLATSQQGDRIVEFGEGEEETIDLPEFMMSLDDRQLGYMKDYLQSQPKVVDYGEFAPDNQGQNTRTDAMDFGVVPGASVSQESVDEYQEILQYCESHCLDPNDDDDFSKAALAVLN